MDLNDLMVFRKVAELGSFSKTAAELGLPKSAVSQKIARLEQDLGVQLLHRTTRKVSLSEVGTSIYEVAVSIRDQSQIITGLVEQLADEPRGVLRVTAPHDLGLNVIAKVLPRFRDQYPDVVVEVDLSNRYVDIVNEGYDLALRATQAGLRDSSLVAKAITQSEFRLYGSGLYFSHRAEPSCVDELSAHHMVAFSRGRRGTKSTVVLQKGKTKTEISVPTAVRVQDMLAVREGVVAGLGLGLLPRFLCETLVATGKLLPVLPAWHSGVATFYGVYPSRRFIPAKTRRFVDELVAYYGPRS